MNFFSIFLLLVTLIISVENVRLRIYFTRATKNCAAAASANQATLFLRHIRPVFFNKKTRQILQMRRFKHRPSDAIFGYIEAEWKEDMTNVSFGAYFSFVRSAKLRKNENPVVNHRLESETLISEKIVVPPGTGTDFSEMYNDAPTLLEVHILYLTPEREERGTYALFRPNSCEESGKWIANEGYYRLYMNNGDLIPVYYDPIESDFYY